MHFVGKFKPILPFSGNHFKLKCTYILFRNISGVNFNDEIAVIFFLNDTKLIATGGTFEHETKQIWSVFT